MLDSKNPFANLCFASIPHAEVDKHYKVVLESGDIEACWLFARTFGHTKDLEDIVLNGNNAEIKYNYAKDVAGADIIALKNSIKSKNDQKKYSPLFDELIAGVKPIV